MPGCAPKRASTGIWRVSAAHSASMVWMRTRCASAGSGRFWSTRRRISAAALRVKVTARISSGCCTFFNNPRYRRTRSSVFPDPAGAWTMNERAGSSAASRSFRSAIISFMIKLYDLAGAEDDRRFSPYCWRTKMALKHKGLEFETVPWRFTEKDAIAFAGSTTVPVIRDGATAVADSWNIAVYLDEAYPSRPGLMDGATTVTLTDFFGQWTFRALHSALSRVVLLDIYARIHEKDKAYFR